MAAEAGGVIWGKHDGFGVQQQERRRTCGDADLRRQLSAFNLTIISILTNRCAFISSASKVRWSTKYRRPSERSKIWSESLLARGRRERESGEFFQVETYCSRLRSNRDVTTSGRTHGSCPLRASVVLPKALCYLISCRLGHHMQTRYVWDLCSPRKVQECAPLAE